MDGHGKWSNLACELSGRCAYVCFPVVPLTLLWYNSYYYPPTSTTTTPLPPQPQEALSFGGCCKVEGHSWHHRDPNNHNAVHWTRKCLLNQAGSLTVAKITHHCHLTGPGGAAGDGYDPPARMEICGACEAFIRFYRYFQSESKDESQFCLLELQFFCASMFSEEGKVKL